MPPAPAPVTPIAKARTTPAAPYLPGVLLDYLAETVYRSPDPACRASTVLALIGEICDNAQWIIDDPTSPEMLSLGRILAEAHAHHTRMSHPELVIEPATTLVAVNSAGPTTGRSSTTDDNAAVAIMSA